MTNGKVGEYVLALIEKEKTFPVILNPAEAG
jgi:hypothetical protein